MWRKIEYTEKDFKKWEKKFPGLNGDENKLHQCLKEYVASLYTTKKLLSIWRNAQHYHNNIEIDDWNIPHVVNRQWCDEMKLYLVLNKFSKHNLCKGRSYYIWLTESEFRKLLSTRENID